MRRILVENARRKRRLRHGGGLQRVNLEDADVAAGAEDETLLQVDEVLEELALEDPFQAQIVKLRFFVGLTNNETANALGVSEKTVLRYWAHAKLWLYDRIHRRP
jgi:RNA polymerase sigma factor (TIGR02999 family)